MKSFFLGFFTATSLWFGIYIGYTNWERPNPVPFMPLTPSGEIA